MGGLPVWTNDCGPYQRQLSLGAGHLGHHCALSRQAVLECDFAAGRGFDPQTFHFAYRLTQSHFAWSELIEGHGDRYRSVGSAVVIKRRLNLYFGQFEVAEQRRGNEFG